MNSLTQILFTLSSALMVPVIVLLLVMVFRALMEVGGFIGEWRQRRRGRRGWQAWCQRVTESDEGWSSGEAMGDFLSQSELPGLIGLFARRAEAGWRSPMLLEKLENDMEIQAARQLGRLSLGIRIGPILGMMGTLIPLGPALIALSNDNVNEMANDLVIAFSTTVLGLMVGGVSYVMWLPRRNWYAQDLADIEFVCQVSGVDRATGEQP